MGGRGRARLLRVSVRACVGVCARPISIRKRAHRRTHDRRYSSYDPSRTKPVILRSEPASTFCVLRISSIWFTASCIACALGHVCSQSAEAMARRGWRAPTSALPLERQSLCQSVSEAGLVQLVCKRHTVAWAEWSAASFMNDPAGGTGYSRRNSQARPRWSTPASMCWRSNRAPSSRMRSLTQSSISSHS